jgi:hypothetical protein
MEEASSSSARGRKPYTRARAQLTDSSDTTMERQGFFLNAKEEAVHAH